jgi:NADPH-dependent 2,4-dienoyl-CoA reductase/sulfur reductase-like enzyme
VVVVGAGAAGLAVAQGLRRGGHEGAIVLVGDEQGTPYDRPPLSKHVLAGRQERVDLVPDKRLASLDIDWRLGHAARSLDVSTRRLLISDGSEIAYDALAIATGVAPRTLPSPSPAGVSVLRTLEDAEALRARLVAGTRLVIVGGGFLGLEVAATAAQMSVDVTVVEPLERPLAARLGSTAAARLLRLHEDHGVVVRTGTSVAEMMSEAHGGGSVETVRAVQLTNGELLEADAVLVAIGCDPNVQWLDGSGLQLDDGVVCDEYCAAADGVWAAGDIARWWHARLGRHVRLEHRMNANEQGQAVAQNILGARTAFAPLPYFWTDHFDVKIQVWGVAGDESQGFVETCVEKDEEGDSFVLTFRDAGDSRLVGVLGWNAARLMPPYRAELAADWDQR